ncbi:YqcI/YcgG family protein [Pseudomonas sp. X10]
MTIDNDFKTLTNATHCPFALNAKLIFAEGIAGHNISQYVTSNIVRFLKFCEHSKISGSDGFVFTFEGKVHGKNIEQLCNVLYLTLSTIARYDDFARMSMATDFLADHWRFMACDNIFTVLAFSPCYPEHNSRYSFGVDRVFLLFQPSSTFAKFSDPHTSRLPAGLKESIRERFSTANRRYDPSISSPDRSHALRFIRPMNLNDSPVEWWNS